jgi:hypothetical protein
MTTRDDNKSSEKPRREGERRNDTDADYSGPDRRKGERRNGDRRKDTRT